MVFVHPQNPTLAQVDFIEGYLERAIASLSPALERLWRGLAEAT